MTMSRILSIDLETTGIPTDDDAHAVVEIGWCEIPSISWGETLVNPGRKIPFEAMAVHHITDDMVSSSPSFEWAWEKRVPGADILIAHNADYERKFIKTDIPFICTYKVALRVWPDMPSHSLQYLRYALGLPVSVEISMPHRAGPDAYVCALLFEKILAQADAPDVETMIRWSNGHPLLPRCPLFKHKGKKWADVPSDYLDWIANKPNDISDGIKANARLELKRRGD